VKLVQEEMEPRTTIGAGPVLDLLSERIAEYNHGIEAIAQQS
jgi:hypothetical protein